MKLKLFICSVFAILLLSGCDDSSSASPPPSSYSVLYHDTGATNGDMPVDSNQYTAGEKVYIFPNESLVSTGRFFAGWNTKEDSTGAFIFGSRNIDMPAQDLHLYPRWLPDPDINGDVLLNVTYNSGGAAGELPVDNNKYIKGYQEAVVRPAGDLSNDGFKFSHWQDDSGQDYTPWDTILMLEDVTLTAQWVPVAQTAAPVSSPTAGKYSRTVKVRLSSATEDASIYYTTDGSDPTTESSLYRAPVFQSQSTTIKAMAVKEDHSGSEISTAEYKIGGYLCYHLKGGTDDSDSPVPDPVWADNGESMTVTSSVPVKNGHEFESWSIQSNGKGEQYKAGDTIDMELGGITLYAQWEKSKK